MNLNRGACAVCNGTGVVWALFAGASDEAVPCAACRVPTGYRTSPPAEESLLDARERELRHMASELATYKNALRDAVERFKGLHKLAVHPMKSWDAGLVIDAQRVEDEAGDALEAIGLAIAAAGGSCKLCGSRITAKGTQCSPGCPANHPSPGQETKR